MRKLILAICLGLLVVAPLRAQYYGYNDVAVVKDWYRHFLHREAEPGGLNGWVNQLRQGQEPAYLLAQIVSGDEYYTKAGANDEDWLVALYQDLTGREPTSRELRYWMGRLDRQTHIEVAYSLVKRYGAA
jgi:hypothetical protein